MSEASQTEHNRGSDLWICGVKGLVSGQTQEETRPDRLTPSQRDETLSGQRRLFFCFTLSDAVSEVDLSGFGGKETMRWFLCLPSSICRQHCNVFKMAASERAIPDALELQ